MKIEIVKFSYGKYAVRKKTILGYTYKHKSDSYSWFSKNSPCFSFCLGEKEEIERLYAYVTEIGEPI